MYRLQHANSAWLIVDVYGDTVEQHSSPERGEERLQHWNTPAKVEGPVVVVDGPVVNPLDSILDRSVGDIRDDVEMGLYDDRLEVLIGAEELGDDRLVVLGLLQSRQAAISQR